MKRWECGIPGKTQTMWEGGLFKLDVTFPDGMLVPCGWFEMRCRRDYRCRRGANLVLFSWSIEYPTKPPKCTFSVSLTFCIYRGLWFLTRIRQVHTSAFSSQRLSFRYRVSLDLERRRSLETRDYHKADSSGHSGSARRPQPRIPGPGRRVQSL